jgi:hypothetical protein
MLWPKIPIRLRLRPRLRSRGQVMALLHHCRPSWRFIGRVVERKWVLVRNASDRTRSGHTANRRADG